MHRLPSLQLLVNASPSSSHSSLPKVCALEPCEVDCRVALDSTFGEAVYGLEVVMRMGNATAGLDFSVAESSVGSDWEGAAGFLVRRDNCGEVMKSVNCGDGELHIGSITGQYLY